MSGEEFELGFSSGLDGEAGSVRFASAEETVFFRLIFSQEGLIADFGLLFRATGGFSTSRR